MFEFSLFFGGLNLGGVAPFAGVFGNRLCPACRAGGFGQLSRRESLGGVLADSDNYGGCKTPGLLSNYRRSLKFGLTDGVGLESVSGGRSGVGMSSPV